VKLAVSALAKDLRGLVRDRRSDVC
jgi:hypothetical protein